MDLKLLSRDALDSALEKAKHYRLLNEPRNAESICLDILAVDENHQEALVLLVLAITDQFDGVSRIKESREILKRITNEYEAAYYAGIICERAAKAILKKNKPGARFATYDWLRDAMEHFDKAEKLSSTQDDDAILRWNACARLINRHGLVPENAEKIIPYHD